MLLIRENEALAAARSEASQLGEDYLVGCDILETVCEHAVRLPGAKTGAFDIRPIMEFAA